jgi:hypothetical protein
LGYPTSSGPYPHRVHVYRPAAHAPTSPEYVKSF